LFSESLFIGTELFSLSPSEEMATGWLSAGRVLLIAEGWLSVSSLREIASGPSLIWESSPAVDPVGIFEIGGGVRTEWIEEDAILGIVWLGFCAFADGIMIAAETPRPRMTDAPIALTFNFREKVFILNLFHND
jgi:hypothetical protein